jgi:hypothetical protein
MAYGVQMPGGFTLISTLSFHITKQQVFTPIKKAYAFIGQTKTCILCVRIFRFFSVDSL